MSWLVTNWFGVFAFFGAPAIVGILGWLVVFTLRRAAERRDRARRAHRHVPLSLARSGRRR